MDEAKKKEAPWREMLAVAMDALKERTASGFERAFEIFDQLDEKHPRWMMEVPWHGRTAGTRRPEVAARCVIAAMLRWEGWTYEQIADAFDLSDSTIIFNSRRGERMLLSRALHTIVSSGGRRIAVDDKTLSSYEHAYPPRTTPGMLDGPDAAARYHQGFGMLEEDFAPAEQRAKARQFAIEHPLVESFDSYTDEDEAEWLANAGPDESIWDDDQIAMAMAEKTNQENEAL